ncbi:MAG: cupin [Neisseria sp.]|nr:cupin [Neisseria sp.]
MKNIQIKLLAALTALYAAAAPAAETAQGRGKVLEGANYTVIRETLPKGSEIPRHNHPGHTLIITLTKGRAAFAFDGGGKQELKQGGILRVDGKENIAINVLDDSEFVIILVKNGRK